MGWFLNDKDLRDERVKAIDTQGQSYSNDESFDKETI